MDEVLEICLTLNEETLAHTSKHFGPGIGELCLGDFEGELLAFTGADKAEFDFDLEWGYCFGRCFCKCDVVHNGPI